MGLEPSVLINADKRRGRLLDFYGNLSRSDSSHWSDVYFRRISSVTSSTQRRIPSINTQNSTSVKLVFRVRTYCTWRDGTPTNIRICTNSMDLSLFKFFSQAP